jgi:hypothetical protein
MLQLQAELKATKESAAEFQLQVQQFMDETADYKVAVAQKVTAAKKK